MFDSKKKIKAATTSCPQHKLLRLQRRPVAMNQCLLYMYSNQSEQCRERAVQLQREHPDSDTPSLLLAACHVKDKHYEAATRVLQVMTRQ